MTTTERLLIAVIQTVGWYFIYTQTNWKTALGIFLVIWMNNLEME